MHIQELVRLVAEAWRVSDGNYDEFILLVDNFCPSLADMFEDGQLHRAVFIGLHMKTFRTAIIAAI